VNRPVRDRSQRCVPAPRRRPDPQPGHHHQHF
jgi:hypothetical protein